jgi:cystathionine gamma-synthase
MLAITLSLPPQPVQVSIWMPNSGVLAFTPHGGFEQVRQVLDGLQLAQRAAHLGGVATTAGPPAFTSHVELTAQERARAGIPENLIRYSAGIENAGDLCADLDQALAMV